MMRDIAATQPADADNLDGVREILHQHQHDRGGLIAILEAVQARYGHLPEAALRTVAEETGRPLVDVYGVATFYRFFTLKPRGKHLVCACLGTACHVRGAPRVLNTVQDLTGIRPGETDLELKFSLETVNCLGCCALGPVVEIDGKTHGNVSAANTSDVLKGYE